jgi:hypothetical protein
MAQIDAADAGIVGVDGGEETVREHLAQWMTREVGDSAGVDVARQVRLDGDAVFEKKIDQSGVFDGAGAVADAFGAEQFNGVPNALRTAGFTGVNGDPPAGIAGLGKMFDEQRRGEIRFVTGQIERDEMLAMREERVEFLMGNLGSVRPAQNSDQVHTQAGCLHPFRDSLHDAFDYFSWIQAMRLGHEPRTKPQLQVIDSFLFRVLHIFPRDPAAGLAICQHPRQPEHLADERHQARLRFRHLDMRPQFFHRRSRQLDSVLSPEVENRFQAEAAIEMAVQVDKGEARVDRGKAH